MSKIIPIRDLRNTNQISDMCKKANEPIFITKNGYEDLVIMSNDCYENLSFKEKTLQNSTKILDSEFKVLPQSDIYGYLKVACATPYVHVGNSNSNLVEIIKTIDEALALNVKVLVFPELSMIGYTAGDLFLNPNILNNIEENLLKLKTYLKDKNIFVIVGAPLRYRSKIYNCAVAIQNGNILGVVPKTYIPNYREFYEKRYFESAITYNDYINICDDRVPFGKNIIFQDLNYLKLRIGIEICEDLWASDSPSTNLAKNGANVIINLSASNETLNKDDFRRELVKVTSSKLISSYIYCSCGDGESTTDLIFSGHNIIAENGVILTESKLFENELTVSDIDLELLETERIRNTSFRDKRVNCDYIYFQMPLTNNELHRRIPKNFFVCENEARRKEQSKQILLMQAKSLLKRLEAIHCNKIVIAFSGGLDSTIALIASYEAFKLGKLPIENIHVLTLPSFGTSSLTYNNACNFAKSLKVTFKEINIKDALIQHFKDIEHDINNANIAFENSQARERTQIAMDYCNDIGAIMVGTGDLSELCLGFTTFGGDHLSNFGLNASLPKTLIQSVVKDYADLNPEYKEVLYSILNTPISPELLPQNGQDTIVQKTEENLGPYLIHDFYIYNFLKYNFSIKKLYFMAQNAFKDTYSDEVIKTTLKTFIRKFFSNQFKRNCLPDGIKIGPISVSPRGDLRLVSDLDANVFINEVNKL